MAMRFIIYTLQQITEDKTDRACCTHGAMKNAYKLYSENLKGRNRLEGVDRK
jgi:hypothetical protein